MNLSRASWLRGLLVLLSAFVLSPRVRAEARCGSAPAGWNAPRGALVVSATQSGPVYAVLAAVGEYYTHSMMSLGPGGNVVHATMRTPGQSSYPTVCDTPLKSGALRTGLPGASLIDQGAIYTFLYADADPIAVDFLRTTELAPTRNWRKTAGGRLVTHLDSEPLVYGDTAQPFARFQNDEGAYMPYSLYQYRDVESTAEGIAGSFNNGAVCSTLLSYFHKRAGLGPIAPFVYAHDRVVSAIDALRGSVERTCNAGLDWFVGGFVVPAACLDTNGVCDDAGRQVANCMAVGRCNTNGTGSNTYKSVRNDPNSVAISISPDRLSGYSGHPYGPYDGGNGISVWAPQSAETVQWNSAGNLYGCWF